MVTILALLGVLGVLVAAAFLSTREEPLLAEAPRDAADLPLPDGPLSPEDVGRLRFSLAPRGYRMSEVDLALERLQAELADRDRRIGLLEAAAAGTSPKTEVREATPADLPVTPPAPAAATGAPTPPLPPVVTLDAPTTPAEVPQEPAPLPAAHPEPPRATPQPASVTAVPVTSLPVTTPPATTPPATTPPAPGAVGPLPPATPAEVPHEPAPLPELPPADLGTDLLSEPERRQQ